MTVFDCQIALIRILPPFCKQNYNIVFFVKNVTIESCSIFTITIYFCEEWRDSIISEKRWVNIQ